MTYAAHPHMPFVRSACTLAVLCALALFGLSVEAHAQNWSGILDPSRAIDWSHNGAAIQSRATLCSTSQCSALGPSSTAAQINAAVQSASSGQVVLLPAGTYNLSGGINLKAGITLRGNGPSSTILNINTPSNCFGGVWTANICVTGSSYLDPQNPPSTTSWTPAAKGTSVITVASPASLAVGQIAYLDQSSDTSADDAGFIYVCGDTTCTVEGASGWSYGDSARVHEQVVRITSINGNLVGIYPPLLMPDWRSSKSPLILSSSVTPIQDVGIEDLRVNNGGSAGFNILFGQAYNCWVKNVASVLGGKGNVGTFGAVGITLRDSYLYQETSYGSEAYGFYGQLASGVLVENNIFQMMPSGPVFNGAVMGCVIGYNYGLQMDFSKGDWWPGIANHNASNDLCLYEGNQMPGIREDNFHGTHNLQTMFRNYFSGNDPAKTQTPRTGSPIVLQNYSRLYNIVGNVLGASGIQTTYASIYTVDTPASATLLRWGNYDTANAAVRWVASEVPSGLAQFANPVPSSQSLPSSFYLSAKPSWWGKMPWPAIGPDVTGGNIANLAGHAYNIPAALCYANTAKDTTGGLTNFNANTCYQQVATNLPAAPTNVIVAVH
jgi:hypothetical protein